MENLFGEMAVMENHEGEGSDDSTKIHDGEGSDGKP